MGKSQHPVQSHGAKECRSIEEGRLGNRLIVVVYREGRDRRLDEIGIQSIYRSQRRLHVVPVSAQCRENPVPVGPTRCSYIEDVSRLDMRSTKMDLLRDDFSDGFDIDVFALNLSSRGGCVG
jgi:hypothetical protein